MSLKVGNKVLPEEMYGMAYVTEVGSKGGRVVVPAREATTPPYVVMLSASYLGQSNYADYTWFLVFGVNRRCPRDCQEKNMAWSRQ